MKVAEQKKQNVTNNIVLANRNMEILRQHFPHCFDKTGAFQIEKFKDVLEGSEVNFSRESYGLDWLGKSYARLLASDPATTLLKANEAHNALPENTDAKNLLIKGDNLEVLKHLVNAYHEQVKMIYIDPPYNTGSDDFVYQDDRKFSVYQLQDLLGIERDRAQRILDFTRSHSNSHSAWLTFLYPRLYISRQLLCDDGVIFVSIDDNEVAQLRILMDEIFGEENFVGNIAWESKTKSQNTKTAFNKLQPKVEHILLYTRAARQRFNLVEKGTKDYPCLDEQGKYREYPLEVMNATGVRGRETMIYEVSDGISFVRPPEGKQWQLGEIQVLEYKNSGNLLIRDGKVIIKMRPEFERQENTEPFWAFLSKEIGTAESAKKEISLLFNCDNVFDTVKPVDLIKRLIFHSTDKCDYILDFFAGSGTTGDAVMQLNAEDGGNRRFILVQLPEAIDPKKSKAAHDFVTQELQAEPTIFEITKERLLRAARKINGELDEKIAALKGELPSAANETEVARLEGLKAQNVFKVFETATIWEDYVFEAEEFEAAQTLFDVGKLTAEDIASLLLTWKTYDGIPLTEELAEVELGQYVAHYGNGKLYLMQRGFDTGHLQALLLKIDSDPAFEPRSVIAFGYQMESKSLRELAENLKAYNNKKQSDIDFIVRY